MTTETKTPSQFMGVNFSLKSMIPEIMDNRIIPILLIPNKRELSSPLSRRARIINESELKQYEDDLLSWSADFPSYVDRCFELSTLFSFLIKC